MVQQGDGAEEDSLSQRRALGEGFVQPACACLNSSKMERGMAGRRRGSSAGDSDMWT